MQSHCTAMQHARRSLDTTDLLNFMLTSHHLLELDLADGVSGTSAAARQGSRARSCSQPLSACPALLAPTPPAAWLSLRPALHVAPGGHTVYIHWVQLAFHLQASALSVKGTEPGLSPVNRYLGSTLPCRWIAQRQAVSLSADYKGEQPFTLPVVGRQAILLPVSRCKALCPVMQGPLPCQYEHRSKAPAQGHNMTVPTS